ncbi:MAG: hypothetical protein ACRDPC_07430 [Solirubrobacteraceae bacterium]
MFTFADAVRDTVERIYGHVDADDAEVRHVRDPNRVLEASAVQELADAFARVELDRPERDSAPTGRT